jgi:hypothetical protein
LRCGARGLRCFRASLATFGHLLLSLVFFACLLASLSCFGHPWRRRSCILWASHNSPGFLCAFLRFFERLWAFLAGSGLLSPTRPSVRPVPPVRSKGFFILGECGDLHGIWEPFAPIERIRVATTGVRKLGPPV